MNRNFQKIIAIAHVTFREQIREKILWSAFLFALLCVGLAYAVSRFSFAENSRVALDFGLTSISLIGGLISIIAGATLISREVENRTIYLVLTKSLSRWHFVIGKWLGLQTVLFVNATLMMLALVLIYVATGGTLSVALFKNFLLQLAEFGVLTAIACIFSAFSTVALSAVFTSGLWVIGHSMVDLRMLINRIEPTWIRPIFECVTKILPDLTRFDTKAQVAHQLPLTWDYTLATFAYGIAYTVFAMIISSVIFSKRDL